MIIDSIQKENSKKVGKYRDNIRTCKMVNSTNDIMNNFLLLYAWNELKAADIYLKCKKISY